MSISTPNAISTPNTSPTITTDALIIGFGKGGKTLADKLSAAGRKVVVAEASADMYGGTCINIGCLPSKSLILSAEQARRDGANSTPETREAAFEAAIMRSAASLRCCATRTITSSPTKTTSP